MDPRRPVAVLGRGRGHRCAAHPLIGALLMGLRPRGAGWHVAVLEGRPTVGWFPLDTRGTLTVGQWLVTDASSRAQIDVGDIGSVEVAPNSRVRLVSARPADNRIELQLGRVRAMIFAPPRQFAVEAPSATAVNLGCVYTMQVTADGAGLLHVESGWVAFAHDGRESFVPAGASAQTRRGIGPGTPYFDDANPRLREALGTSGLRTGDVSKSVRSARGRARDGPRARRNHVVAPPPARPFRRAGACVRPIRAARSTAGHCHARRYSSRRSRHAGGVVGPAPDGAALLVACVGTALARREEIADRQCTPRALARCLSNSDLNACSRAATNRA